MTLLTNEQIQIATACASRNNPECSKCIFTDAPVCTDSLMAALIEDRNEMIKIIEENEEKSIQRLRDFAKMLGLAAQPKEGEEDKWVYLTDGVWIYLDKDKKE